MKNKIINSLLILVLLPALVVTMWGQQIHAVLSIAQTWTAIQTFASGVNMSSAAFAALTDGATVSWDVGTTSYDNTSLTFTVHGGNRTLNITNLVSGGQYVLWLKQDSTGGEGLVLGTGCTWKVAGGGAGAITLSTTANAVDVLAFTYDGTNCYATLTTNFS